MICYLCQQDKLSNEFPFDPLSEECDHPLLHCLRCAAASVKMNQKCSQCDNHVNEDNIIYQEYMETLESLFPIIEPAKDAGQTTFNSRVVPMFANIKISTATGDCADLPYNPNQTIVNIKQEIEKKLNVPSNRQRLLHEGNELRARNESNEFMKLKDYQVPHNATLSLMVLLYAIPEGLDNVIFDLCWEFPPNQTRRWKKFLDSSVFIYSGSQCLDIVDYKNTRSSICPAAIRHSGKAKMDFQNKISRNRILVSLKAIPEHIDKLVFTLSAFNSVNLANYPNPSLRFYDAKYPDKLLCSDEMSHALHCQAIIMCSLSRKDGEWETISLKSRAAGCAKNYSPLQRKIENLIRSYCM